MRDFGGVFLFIRFPQTVTQRGVTAPLRHVERGPGRVSLCAPSAAGHPDVDRGCLDVHTFATSAFSTCSRYSEKIAGPWGRSKSATCGRHSASGCCWFRWARVLSSWSLPKRIQLMGMSSLVSGVALLGLIVTSNRLAAAALMVIIGMGARTWLTPVAWGVLQEIAPASLLGRVWRFTILAR